MFSLYNWGDRAEKNIIASVTDSKIQELSSHNSVDANEMFHPKNGSLLLILLTQICFQFTVERKIAISFR